MFPPVFVPFLKRLAFKKRHRHTHASHPQVGHGHGRADKAVDVRCPACRDAARRRHRPDGL